MGEQVARCQICKCPLSEKQVERCKRKFEHLDYYKNKVYCEEHFKPIADRLDEKLRKSREKYKYLNPSWYYGGLWNTMLRLNKYG